MTTESDAQSVVDDTLEWLTRFLLTRGFKMPKIRQMIEKKLPFL